MVCVWNIFHHSRRVKSEITYGPDGCVPPTATGPGARTYGPDHQSGPYGP